MPSPTLLKTLKTLDDGPFDEGYEREIVREGRQCWLGIRRISGRIVDEAVRCSAVENVGNGGVDRFVITETGRAILRRPELADEIVASLLSGRPFTIHGDRVASMADPTEEPDLPGPGLFVF